MFAGKLLVTPTGRRLNGVAELQAILDEVRARGYAENWEETAESPMPHPSRSSTARA
jgi:DNA-binding IclR family transcriptional regulator